VDLYLVATTGRARRVQAPDTNCTLGRVAVDSKGGTVALPTTEHGGVCSNYDGVALLDVRTGTLAVPPPPRTKVPLYVGDLHWTPAGELLVSAAEAPASCAGEPNAAAQMTEATAYRVDKTHWTDTRNKICGRALSTDGRLATLGASMSVDDIGGMCAGRLEVAGAGTTVTIGAAPVTWYAWSS